MKSAKETYRVSVTADGKPLAPLSIEMEDAVAAVSKGMFMCYDKIIKARTLKIEVVQNNTDAPLTD